MIFSRIFVYSCLFLVIFVFIPLVDSDSCNFQDIDSYNDFYDITILGIPISFFVGLKEVEEDRPSTSKSREYKCSNCGAKNDHYKPTCPHNNNYPSYERKDELIYTSRVECFFNIEAKKFVKRGERIPSNCDCAYEEDERCHGIADVLGGPGICENCFSCSREMNIKMRKMENFVKKSDGGIYVVSCDDSKYAKSILQIFEPYNGVATTTVIYRESPTNIHYEV